MTSLAKVEIVPKVIWAGPHCCSTVKSYSASLGKPNFLMFLTMYLCYNLLSILYVLRVYDRQDQAYVRGWQTSQWRSRERSKVDHFELTLILTMYLHSRSLYFPKSVDTNERASFTPLLRLVITTPFSMKWSKLFSESKTTLNAKSETQNIKLLDKTTI